MVSRPDASRLAGESGSRLPQSKELENDQNPVHVMWANGLNSATSGTACNTACRLVMIDELNASRSDSLCYFTRTSFMRRPETFQS